MARPSGDPLRIRQIDQTITIPISYYLASLIRVINQVSSEKKCLKSDIIAAHGAKIDAKSPQKRSIIAPN